jgi:NAD(P)H-dependent FMN reductase
MQLVSFCGSAGNGSANQALLDVVGGVAVDRGWEVAPVEGLAAVPMFDPDIGDDEAPAAVVALRQRFETADAVVLAIPEYAGGTAGWAKNALDWMVGSGSLYRRITAVLCAGTTGGPNAVGQVARTLAWQGAFVVAALGVASPFTKRDLEGRIVDEATLVALTQVMDHVEEAAGDESRREALVARTLERLAIPLHDRTGA